MAMDRLRAYLKSLSPRVVTNRAFLIQVSHLFGLCALAIALPLYNLLGQNPTFFIAHNATPKVLWLFALSLSVFLPFGLALIEAMVLILHKPSQRVLHTLFVTGAVGLLTVQFLSRLTDTFGYLLILMGALLGLGCSFFYWRMAQARSFFSIISVVALIVPVIFLFFSPVQSLLFSSKVEITKAGRNENNPPIVFVIFDEFSLHTILKEDGTINDVWFPNLAEFSKGATWFPKAMAIDYATHRAIPAMLSSTHPVRQGGGPNVKNYPNNLFTWLAPEYNFNVVEPITALCPEAQCGLKRFDLDIFIADLEIVFKHVIYPDDLAAQYLPEIGSNWAGFGYQNDESISASETTPQTEPKFVEIVSQTMQQDRVIPFEKFIANIKQGNTLNFYHALLPHTPWLYTPSGLQYTSEYNTGILNGVWASEPSLLKQNYHRYLLQVGLVDTLIGRLIDHLKTQNIYEDAIIVLTSDHGISFTPGGHKRRPYESNPTEILRVPFFIKAPSQNNPVVDTRVVTAMDILPSLAELLKIPLSWESVGASVFNSEFQELTKITIERRTFNVNETLSMTLADWQRSSFTLDVPLNAVVIKGPSHNELIGRDVNGFKISTQDDMTLKSGALSKKGSGIAGKDRFPFLIEGEVIGKIIPDEKISLAFAVNGKIVLTTSTFHWRKYLHYFKILIPEAAFNDKTNVIEGYRIEADNRQIRLHKLKVYTP